jgi:hypothetical protein
VSASPFLLVEDVAERWHCSVRSVHEATRTLSVPHLKRPGSRRILFREDWLAAFESGAELEVVEQARGGRVVRPRGAS